MIRKILFALALLYSTSWFVIGHVLKGAISEFILQDSDDLYSKYDDIKLSGGFPGRWTFTISNPLMEVRTDDTTYIVSNEVCDIAVNLNLRDVKITPSTRTLIEVKSENTPVLYKIYARSSPQIKLRMNSIIPMTSSIILDDISVAAKDVTVDAEQELMSINDLFVRSKIVRRNNETVLRLDANIDYAGVKDIVGFASALLSFGAEVKYSMPANTENSRGMSDIFIHYINVENFGVVLEDKMDIALDGDIAFTKGKIMPDGRFDIVLQNYADLLMSIDPDMKYFIDKASGSDAQEAELSLVISDNGVTVNGVNITDYYKKRINND